MRLTERQKEIIVAAVHDAFGADAEVALFGSRLADERRGGDVDLYVACACRPSLLERARLERVLEEALGLPVDLVVVQRGATLTPFQRIAAARAVPLR